jgi:hypothetical protein
MKSYLKVKACTLAAEASIIKTQEQKWKKKAADARKREKDPRFAEANFFGLQQHRKQVVRREARLTNLAYGFMLGRSYRQIEQMAYIQPDWDAIESMVSRFSTEDERDTMQLFSEWKSDALDGHEVDIQWLDADVGSVKTLTAWSSKAWQEQSARAAARREYYKTPEGQAELSAKKAKNAIKNAVLNKIADMVSNVSIEAEDEKRRTDISERFSGEEMGRAE